MLHTSDESSRMDSKSRTDSPVSGPEITRRLASPTSSVALRELESPALIRGTAKSDVPSAFELKCLIEPAMMRQLETFLASSLTLDPFSQTSFDGHYPMTTVSTDTETWSVFHREPGFASRKFRLRRYGDEPRVYLERKSRRGSRVRKQRSQVLMEELTRLGTNTSDADWSGDWFSSQVQSRRLRPVCVMNCERKAWFGKTIDGTMRLTFDRGLRTALVTDSAEWRPIAASQMLPVTGDNVICEFKFCGSMPLVFKSAIQEFGLHAGGYSKFRNCIAMLTGMSLDSSRGSAEPLAGDQKPSAFDAANPGANRHA